MVSAFFDPEYEEQMRKSHNKKLLLTRFLAKFSILKKVLTNYLQSPEEQLQGNNQVLKSNLHALIRGRDCSGISRIRMH